MLTADWYLWCSFRFISNAIKTIFIMWITKYQISFFFFFWNFLFVVLLFIKLRDLYFMTLPLTNCIFICDIQNSWYYFQDRSAETICCTAHDICNSANFGERNCRSFYYTYSFTGVFQYCWQGTKISKIFYPISFWFNIFICIYLCTNQMPCDTCTTKQYVYLHWIDVSFLSYIY